MGQDRVFLLDITYKHGTEKDGGVGGVAGVSWYQEQKKLLDHHIPHNSLLCFISAPPAWAVKLPEQ